MRFSLGTFVLLILFVSSVYAVVMTNDQWHLAQTIITPFEGEKQKYGMRLNDFKFMSPDETRKLGPVNREYPWFFRDNAIALYEHKSNVYRLGPDDVLLQTFKTPPIDYAYFVSDSEFHVLNYLKEDTSQVTMQIYRRRYVNTVWGHATRSEVIAVAVTFLLLVIQFARYCVRVRGKSA